MGIVEKIKAIEEELGRTQKHKGTEYHIGLLKAKLAKLRRELISPKKGRRGGGFEIRKSGDATVAIIGPPSVGKSTLLNALTDAESKTAPYAFTTLKCIPGVLNYKGARIQVLDLPGILEGAREGRGKGREILAVARSSDLILILLDVFQPHQLEMIKRELEGIGIRLDKRPPQIYISKREKGGVRINSTVKLKLDERTIRGILEEYGIHNGEVVFREDAGVEELIDVLAGNRKYIPSVVALNKVDLVSEGYLRQLGFEFLPISASTGKNIELLKEKIYNKLNLIRVYTKPRRGEADLKEPLMLRAGSNVRDVFERVGLEGRFKYAQVWGKSAKFPGQKVGGMHVLEDGDIVSIICG